MRKKSGEIEVFSISLIDLISGALGVMSILFFTVIPNMGSGVMADSKEQDSFKPLTEMGTEVITYHIIHSGNVKMTLDKEASFSKSLSSQYMIGKDRFLLKATFEKKSKVTSKEVMFNTNQDTIFESSYIISNSQEGSFLYYFEKDSIGSGKVTLVKY